MQAPKRTNTITSKPKVTPTGAPRPCRYRHNYWQFLLVIAVVCGLTQLYLFGQATAQSLNDQVNLLLDDTCVRLLGVGNSTNGLGPNLTRLCTAPSGGAAGPLPFGASSTGGGAASFQGSAASILNRMVQQRLDKSEEESQTNQQSSSTRLNPFGTLVSGFGLTPSISSPFYATTAGDGSSSAVFSTSNHSRWKGVGFFASGLVESLNRDITTFQDGYKSTIFG